MAKIITLLICFFYTNLLFGQVDTTPQKIYHVKLKYELPVSTVCIGLSIFGFRELDRVSTMSATDIAKLNPADINAFDRPIALLDPSGFATAQKNSDLFLNISIFSPVLLALDKRIRKDWLDLVSLYLISHAVDNAIYFAAAYPVRRPRPLTYNPKLDISEKTGEAKSNSFFSGHVSFAATATFFAAKVYTDYHHIKSWKRLLWYAAAAVPPALVGYYRTQAGKHFKTDVLLGFLVGASSGIVVPQLHKIRKKHDNISFYPFYTPGSGGMTVTMTF